MKEQVVCLFLIILLFGCQDQAEVDRHVFYLHGRIIELQGIHAVSEVYGAYQYKEIIDALKNTGAIVHHEVRTAETDFQGFSEKIAKQIDSLILIGVPASHITVVGASKGAVMAMNISSINSHPVNYVLLAANNDRIEQENDWNLHGKILGIYEQSDTLAGKDYSYWIARSTKALVFKELKINTGLGHGFLYQPLSDWLTPTVEWIGK